MTISTTTLNRKLVEFSTNTGGLRVVLNHKNGDKEKDYCVVKIHRFTELKKQCKKIQLN